MLELLSSLDWLAIIVSAIAYHALGGLWYARPVFGRRWEAAIGFARPAGWHPGPRGHVVRFLGRVASSLATAILARAADIHSVAEALTLGLVVGLGYGAAIAGCNATSPTIPRPFAAFAIAGSYHVVGLVVVALLVTLWP